MNFEEIMSRVLDRIVQSDSTLDTRVDSVIYNAVAPAAYELSLMYNELNKILDETFVDTASRDSLIKRCKERGIKPKSATKAILKGKFNMDVPISSRFSNDSLSYIVTEKIASGIFKLECEAYGSVGNWNYGKIIPIDNISGLEIAEITELLIAGEDDEGTETLRERYYSSLGSQAFGGNKADYKEKIKLISGVGGCKTERAFAGGGTVKVVLIDSMYNKPSAELISLVQNTVDPIGVQGEGVGIAPIGHIVTVSAANESQIDIETTITYQAGWGFVDSKTYIEEAIDGYFLQLSKDWEDQEALIVRISQIETRLLNVPGILDIANTMLNSKAQNLILGTYNIPVRGDFIG